MFFFLLILRASDCDLVESLALGLHLNLANPTMMSIIRLNCCNSKNVTCVGTNVTSIRWGGLGLNGTINSTAIPPNIEVLELESNSIWGEMPMMTNLTFLTNIKLEYNNLSGPFKPFPSNIGSMTINTNKLTGSLFSFPTSLNSLTAFENMLNGSIPDNMPISLNLRSNFLTGSIPTLPPNMKVLRLSDNFLSGPISPIPRTFVVLAIGISKYEGNRISGALVFNAPTEIKIVNNKFTSITIEDKTQLIYCDVSYNPISTKFLNNLPMCVQDFTAGNYTEFVIQVNDTISKLSSQTSITSTLSSTVTFINSTTVVLTTLRRNITSLLSFQPFKTKMPNLTTIKLPIPSTFNTTTTAVFDFETEIDFYYYPFQLLKCFVDFSFLVYLLYKLYKRRFGKSKARVHIRKSDLY